MKLWPPFAYPDPDGRHRNAAPNLAQRGSWPDARGYQQMLDELIAVVVGAGLTPDQANSHQVLDAILALIRANRVFGSRVAIFGAPGTFSWTAPAGVDRIVRSTVWGSGGSGGATDANPYSAASGGGAGSYCESVGDPVVPGNTYAVIVAAGGAPPAIGQNGNNGATSSFGGILSAPGGRGGRAGLGGSITTIGGAGGDPASGGNVFNLPGGGGGSGFYAYGMAPLSGVGAAPRGGSQSGPNASTDGGNGYSPGGGGAGAAGSNHIGGAGGDGLIVLQY